MRISRSIYQKKTHDKQRQQQPQQKNDGKGDKELKKKKMEIEIHVEFLSISCFVLLIDRMTLFIFIRHARRSINRSHHIQLVAII